MKIGPYITFDGNCSEAVELYKRAFKTDTLEVLLFEDLPSDLERNIPEEYKKRVVQAVLPLGDHCIRMSDCGPAQTLNAPESERVSIVVETDAEKVKSAFAVLAEEGRVGMEPAETFYSPCAGVVFDKFGVMWNFAAQKD